MLEPPHRGGDLRDEPFVVADQHHRAPGGGVIANQLAHHGGGRGVQGGGRFVQQQHLRFDGQCAIFVIAVFFTTDLNPAALGAALAGLVVFHLLQRYRVRGWWWYVPLGLAIWALTYHGGVHATVAGVAMGLILRTTSDAGADSSPGERTEHLLRPVRFPRFLGGLDVPPVFRSWFA